MAASTRSAFTSGRVCMTRRAALRPAVRRTQIACRAMIREWPDQEFVAVTLESFPDKGVADVEEARVSMQRIWREFMTRDARDCWKRRWFGWGGRA